MIDGSSVIYNKEVILVRIPKKQIKDIITRKLAKHLYKFD